MTEDMDDSFDYFNSTSYDGFHRYHGHDDSFPVDGVHRFLAPASGAPTVDYSVISIIVITLGIVLAVEVLRHQLDVAASGNPFFHTVLELMYRELTTLGIVEFCIYLMHKYQKDFNFQMEAMFVDVHFMLFYTAVFNALQSCLVRLLTGRLTDRVWVQTEDMDIRHYVALRREYDRLERKMLNNGANISSHSEMPSSSDIARDSEATSAWLSFREALRDLAFKLRHPHRSRRMFKLMLPIRFHALRAHFIDSNKLPPKFKVSHYLKRSLTSVLLDFVHISSAAWIMLMVTANFLWFVSGLILYDARKTSWEVEDFLTVVFIAMMVLFVVFAFVLHFKMKSIFSAIMNMKLMTVDAEDSSAKISFRDGARVSGNEATTDQLKLFWGGNPHIIIVATQYMQFGYALGFAVIFTYFRDFQKMHKNVSPSMLLVVLLLAYLVFLKLVSDILPQYTICTSIGQLANKERLNETLAKLQLTEEIRRKETLETEKQSVRRKEEIELKNAKAVVRAEASKLPNLLIKDPKFAYQESESPRPENNSAAGNDALDRPSSNSDHSSLEPRKVSGFKILQGRSSDALDLVHRRSWRRHTRKKSLSDGAQFMAMSVDGPSRNFDPIFWGSQVRSDALDETKRKDLDQFHRQSSLSDGDRFTSCIDPHRGGLVRPKPNSYLPSTRLSAAAAQKLHIVEENEHRMDKFLLKTNVKSSRRDPLIQLDSRKKLSVKSMSLADTVVLEQTLQSITTQKEGGTGPQNDIGQSLNVTGKEKISSDPSAHLVAAMIPQIKARDIENKGYPGTSNFLTDQTKDFPDGVSSMQSSHPTDTDLQVLPDAPDVPHEASSKGQPRTIAAREVATPMKSLPDGVTPTRSSCPTDTDWQDLNVKGNRAAIDGRTSPRAHSDDDTGFKEVIPKQAVPKMQHNDKADDTNGGHSVSLELLTDRRKLPLGKNERKQRRRRMKAQSDGVSFMRSSLPTETEMFSMDSIKEKEPNNLPALSELAQLSTQDLPNLSDFPQLVRPERRTAAIEGVSATRKGPSGSALSVDDISVGNTTKGLKDNVHKEKVKNATKMRTMDEIDDRNAVEPTSSKNASSLGKDERKQRRRRMKAQSDGVSFMRSSLPTETEVFSLDSIKEKEPSKLPALSELVQLSTKDLPNLSDFPQHAGPKRRRNRVKAASEGVSAMRKGLTNVSRLSVDDIVVGNTMKGMKDDVAKMRHIDETDVTNRALPSSSKNVSSLGKDERKQRRRLMKTQSEGVFFMRSSLPTKSTRLPLDSIKEISALAQLSTKDLPDLADPDFSRKVRRKAWSRNRSASEGVLLMRAGLTDNVATVDAIDVSLDTAVPNLGKDPKGFPLKHEYESIMPTESTKSKVTFALNISPPETTSGIRDDESFASTVSEDGDSDFDDGPKTLKSDVASQSRLQTIKQNIDIAAFFEGMRYRTISLIFGPMACFFFVAMRVEIFNIYAGTFVDQTGIWKDALAPCFWMQVSLYCLMILEMISVLIAFWKRGGDGILFSCSAAILGLLINVMCLLLLLIAEMKRCCPEHDDKFTRLLADPAPSKGYDIPADEYVECCPKFGERRYGGLGKIEPFTCLIALSPLRFVVAGCIVRLSGNVASHGEAKGANHEHHGPDPTTKVRALWMTAIGLHSDIAKIYGVFSGEMLQCMLGIYSVETSKPKTPSIHATESQLSVGDLESSDANNESAEHDSSQHLERENTIDNSTSSRGILGPSKSLAVKRHEYFEYPESRLIRRMRRCEMRLLPLLNDEWILVDVCITRHEIILFDILDETDPLQSPNAPFTYDKSGGKLFPLRDVAEGRAIMDQFNIDEVDFVDIEHRAAIPDDACNYDIENYNSLREYWEGGNCSCGDYDADVMNSRWSRVDEDRLKIHFKDKQTLYLRFMVDLKEMEHKRMALADDPDVMHHIGTHTKLWCRCIARLRGAANLKQDLPHFDKEDKDEMVEDFVEICDRNSESGHHTKKKRRSTFYGRIGSSMSQRETIN